jgi:hypothetical protein
MFKRDNCLAGSQYSSRTYHSIPERVLIFKCSSSVLRSRRVLGKQLISTPSFAGGVEIESGAGSDHDVPYRFALPASMPQVLAWMRLLATVHRGEVQP